MTAASAGARTGIGSLPAMSIFHRRRGSMDCFALGKDLDADEEPPPPLREASGGPSVTTLAYSSTIGANGCLLRSSRGCMHIGIPVMWPYLHKIEFLNRLLYIYRDHQFIGLIRREGSLSESDNSRNGCRTEHSRSVKPRRMDMSYRRVQRAVLAGSAALVLAACGGGGSDNVRDEWRVDAEGARSLTGAQPPAFEDTKVGPALDRLAGSADSLLASDVLAVVPATGVVPAQRARRLCATGTPAGRSRQARWVFK